MPQRAGMLQLEKQATVNQVIDEMVGLRPDHVVVICIKDDESFVRTTIPTERAEILADILTHLADTIREHHAGLKH